MVGYNLKVTIKSFEELASVSVPVLQLGTDGHQVCLQHLGFKNFNQPKGKYLYIANQIEELRLLDEIIVNTEQYEDCYLTECGVKLGRWMVNIEGKVK